jgi:hypothetical protein
MDLKLYRDSYKTFEHKDKVSFDEYKLVAQSFFNILMRSMMKEGYVYSLPFSLGTLGILKYKAKKIPINWVESKKQGVIVTRNNFHTNTYIARFKWLRNIKNVAVPSIPVYWKFRAARVNQRDLAKLIFTDNTMSKYYTTDDY